jgi:DUF4097 and DUF4098 domain-containing protein YvlB
MTLTGWGRTTIAIGLTASVAVGADAQQSRNGSDRTDQSDSRSGETETVTKTVPLPASGSVRLHTFSGYVHITGTSGRDVSIKAVRRAKREVLDHVHLTIDSSGSTVTIDANDKDRDWSRNHNDDQVVHTDFDIEMPASASLDVNGFSSPVEVTNVTGGEHLETFSGRITVTGAKGSIDAHTFSADVDVDLVAAGAKPSLEAHTFSGSIRTKLADAAKADVQFNSFSGQFNSDLPLTMRAWRRGRVEGRVGSGSDSSSSSDGAALRFETFSGDVRIVK